MARKNYATNYKKASGGKDLPRGMGFTATATNRQTGNKTTRSGTLTPTTRSSFATNSSAGKKRTVGVSTNTAATSARNTSRASRKIY